MKFELTLAERETHLNMMGNDHSRWVAHSSDPYFWRRMEELGIVPVETQENGTRIYHLDARTVSFRRIMQISDDERARRAVSAQHARQARRSVAQVQAAKAGIDR
jgi:hypothetical protein